MADLSAKVAAFCRAGLRPGGNGPRPASDRERPGVKVAVPRSDGALPAATSLLPADAGLRPDAKVAVPRSEGALPAAARSLPAGAGVRPAAQESPKTIPLPATRQSLPYFPIKIENQTEQGSRRICYVSHLVSQGPAIVDCENSLDRQRRAVLPVIRDKGINYTGFTP